MRSLMFFLLTITLVTLALLVSSNHAQPAPKPAPAQTTQSATPEPCGCTSACMGTDRCSISCPVGRQARCECKTVGARGEQSPHCYCS